MHLLEALEPYKYTYAGEVELISTPYEEEQVDEEGQLRKVWMFPIRLKPGGITPVLTEAEARAIEESQAKKARQLSTAELKARAEKANKKPSVRVAQASAYVRDAAVAEYVKRLANGVCDLCERPAPFRNKQNEGYLECHHITWLAKGVRMRSQTLSCYVLTAIAKCMSWIEDRQRYAQEARHRAGARQPSEFIGVRIDQWIKLESR